MTYAIIALIVGILIGRASKRQRTVRVSSSNLFHKRPDVYPVMQRWDADIARKLSAGRQ
jgi:hypothetical protein